MPGRLTSARYSEPKATYWSVSAMTAGLQAIGSRTTPKPDLVPTTKVKKPSRSSSALVQRLPEILALGHFGREIGGSDLGVVFGLEGHALPHQFAAQVVVVGQRAVVHQALVGAGREGMRAERRDRQFSRHAGMADAVRAGHGADAETRDDILRQADFLVNLDAVARAHDANVGAIASRSRAGLASTVSHGTAMTACVLLADVTLRRRLPQIARDRRNPSPAWPTGW